MLPFSASASVPTLFAILSAFSYEVTALPYAPSLKNAFPSLYLAPASSTDCAIATTVNITMLIINNILFNILIPEKIIS